MADLLDTHLELLEKFRHSMNLVGPGPAEEHFTDCRLALQWLRPEGRWVDLGSGAGFPGIPLVAMHPDLQVDLVDSRQKRCTFLEMVLEQAEVSPGRAAVHCARVETIEGPYQGVVSRAFAPPPKALAHARRLLAPGGTVVLFLQDEAEDTFDGWETFHVERYRLGPKRRKSAGLRLR